MLYLKLDGQPDIVMNKRAEQNTRPETGSVCVACNKQLDSERQPGRGVISGREMGTCRTCTIIINHSMSSYSGLGDECFPDLTGDVMLPFDEALRLKEDDYDGYVIDDQEGFAIGISEGV